MKNDVLAIDENARIVALEREVLELRSIVKYYEELFLLSKNKQFGASSEKSEYDQLSFGGAEEGDDLGITESAEEPDIEIVKGHYRKKRARSDRLPKDMPIKEIVYELPEEERACPDCGEEMRGMGHEYRDELVVIPAKVMIRRHAARAYICKECSETTERTPILKAEMPKPVIKGSFASPESVAFAAHQKFVMGVPLYRQEQEWKRQGVLLSRQTMANWLIRCAEQWLQPLANELKRRMLLREVLHADETTLQVLKELGKKPQSLSYMWCYRTSGDTDEPIVLAEYRPDRKACNPSVFLKGYSGYLHTDGYDAYHKLPSDIIVVGCWAHARRKWDEAVKVVGLNVRKDSTEMRGKWYCDKLFAIEREIAHLDAGQRHTCRTERLKPVMDELYAWASDIKARPKSSLGKAVSYMFSQRQYLQNVLLDGRLELSNNRAERTIKPFVICRKNFLFANTPRGAAAAAIIFSLIETAKETGINPFDYLAYVFTTTPNVDLDNPDNLNMLLPIGYKKAHRS
jgi:transposase